MSKIAKKCKLPPINIPGKCYMSVINDSTMNNLLLLSPKICKTANIIMDATIHKSASQNCLSINDRLLTPNDCKKRSYSATESLRYSILGENSITSIYQSCNALDDLFNNGFRKSCASSSDSNDDKSDILNSDASDGSSSGLSNVSSIPMLSFVKKNREKFFNESSISTIINLSNLPFTTMSSSNTDSSDISNGYLNKAFINSKSPTYDSSSFVGVNDNTSQNSITEQSEAIRNFYKIKNDASFVKDSSYFIKEKNLLEEKENPLLKNNEDEYFEKSMKTFVGANVSSDSVFIVSNFYQSFRIAFIIFYLINFFNLFKRIHLNPTI